MELDLGKEMIKKLYIIILIILLSALAARAQTPPFAGSGTSGDPYQINSAALFDSLRNPTWGSTDGLYFILTADIDLSGYADWTPIPELRGNLDGQWHTISNMTITTIPDNATDVRIGLFAVLTTANSYSNVEKLRIKNFTIDVNDQTLVNNVNHHVGLVAGYISTSSSTHPIVTQVVVDSSSFKFNINQSGSELYVGGIVGKNYVATVYQCLVQNTVIDTVYAPGVAAYAAGIIANPSTEIRQCAFKGEIRKEIAYSYGGAIAAFSSEQAVGTADGDYGGIVDCYARGKQVNADGTIFSGLLARFGSSFSTNIFMRYSYMQSDSNYAPISGAGRYYTGNLLGYTPDNHPGFHKSYWDISTDKGNKLSVGYPNGVDTTGTGIIDDSLKSQTFLENNGWNFTTVWKIDPAKNDGYPYLQWEDNIPNNEISLVLPTAGDFVAINDSITVQWTGGGDYKNVIINSVDTFLNVTTAKIVAPGTAGTFGIKVAILSDTTVFDSTYVNVIPGELIQIDTASIANDSISTTVLTAGLDSIRFYLSNGINSPTFITNAQITRAVLDSTYLLPIPSSFHNIGSSVTLIVNQDVDTTMVSPPTIYLAGQYGSWQGICWSNKDSTPIEVRGIYDPGCGWVLTTKGYTTTWANFQDDTTYLSQGVNYYTREQQQNPEVAKVWQKKYIYMIDTTGGGAVLDSMDIVDLPQYDNDGDGVSITYKNRYYVITDSILYINDLVNPTGSIQVDLHDYYIPSGITATPFINPKLYLFEYSTRILDTLLYNGSPTTLTLPLLNDAKIGIYESSLDQALYYFTALPEPIPKTLLSDTYALSGRIKIIRNYFRGIDPAFIRNPHK